MAEAVGSATVSCKKKKGNKKAPRSDRGVFCFPTKRDDYFDTAFLKARSIFSLVASQQAWLACAACSA
jgi:hypothetical protein